MKTLKYENIDQNKDSSNVSINELLKEDKQLVSFIGPRQSGTSFLIDNISKILARRDIDVAILDLTSNRASYYIYTKNEEKIKQQQQNCLKNLAEGNPLGIQVEKNLVVYTDLQRENEKDLKAEKILEVLLKKHKIIILDTDFSTDVSYFLYSKKIYLVQTMDVLTIQSFTEFLSKLKSQNAINDEKIRVVLNKFINLNGITEKELINRLAFYNDPTKSYMQQLFEKNGLKYTTIPYNQLAYETYLQYMAEYKITKVEYIIGFKNQLDGLADDVIS